MTKSFKDELNDLENSENIVPLEILTTKEKISTLCTTTTIEEAELIWKKLAVSLDDSIGYGLAANQIGINKRVALIKYAGKTYRLLNTRIIERSLPTIMYGEGCLSLPGVTINTERFQSIVIQDDVLGRVELDMAADGLLPAIVQHEVDHFDGLTIYDRKRRPIVKTKKIGRNELCPCGSGKKYKKCCELQASRR